MSQDGILRVERINLPHYDVVYRTARPAMRDARAIKTDRVFVLGRPLHEVVGSNIVLDLSVDDLTARTTLLFRFIGARDDSAVLEWVPRRKRDPDLLDLWIATLEHEPTRDTTAVTPDQNAARARLLALCRRFMVRNPFTSLGVHWAVGDAEVREAARKAREGLEAMAGIATDPVTERFVKHGFEGIAFAEQQLGSVAARTESRARYVPREQLDHARALARNKLEVARLRGDRASADEQLRLLVELADD